MKSKKAFVTISTFFLIGIVVALYSLASQQRREETGYIGRVEGYFNSIEASINKMLKFTLNVNISSNGTAIRIQQGLPVEDFSAVNSFLVSYLNNLSESDANLNVSITRGDMPFEIAPQGIIYRNPISDKIEIVYNQNLTIYHVDLKISDNIQNCQWNNFVAGTFPVEIRAVGHNKVCEEHTSVTLNTLTQYQIRVESNQKDLYINFTNTILVTRQSDFPQTNATTTFIFGNRSYIPFQNDFINVTMPRFNITRADYPRIYENL